MCMSFLLIGMEFRCFEGVMFPKHFAWIVLLSSLL